MPDEFQPISAKGGNGQIYFDGRQLKISRDGFAGRMTVGSGAKSIPISSITAVRFRAAGFSTKGFVQFSVLGDLSVKGNLSSMNLEKDENTVILHSSKQSMEVKIVVDAIESALANRSVPDQIPATVVQQETSKGSYLDDLLKIAELRDRGIFTEEEFLSEKAKILGNQQRSEKLPEQISDNDEVYLWILGWPTMTGWGPKSVKATLKAIGEILGLPEKPPSESYVYPFIIPRDIRKMNEPNRFNKLLSRKEADEILSQLRNLGFVAELRQS